jgi:hypothetical protein
MSRLTQARERLAALRATVRALTQQIISGQIDDPVLLERQLIGFREHEIELVREIAELEGGDDGSAGALVPRTPRPLPIAGAGAAPIPAETVVLTTHLSEP